jgi:CubicO group peptidase (beta-lactamase class C family)
MRRLRQYPVKLAEGMTMKSPFHGLICLCLLFAIAVSASSAESDSSPTGLWLGLAEAQSGPMRFDVDLAIEEGELSGVFVLVSEGGARLPIEQADYDSGTLRLVTMQGSITLDGRHDGDLIEGSLHTATSELPMRLAWAGSEPAIAMTEELERGIAELRSVPLVLRHSGPGMETIDQEALAELLAAAEASYTTAMALLHDGELVGEWRRGDGNEPIETMSVTKVALNLIIGRLITLRQLDSIDTPVHHFYPQWADDQQRAAITIRHLLAHSSGIDRGQPAGPIYQSGDFVAFALNAPLEFEPGTQLVYSNNATNLLGGVIAQIVGKPLEDFLAEDLFGVMGIEEFAWAPDPAGNPQGMAGLRLTAADLVKLGQLALDRGDWQGEQLIDAAWFEQSFQPGSEHSQRVGLIWFLDRDEDRLVGASHSGYLGQWLGIRFHERIVGARLIRQSPAYKPETDVFQGFVGMLHSLAPAQSNSEVP